jgi:DNA-binding response OmpR family regulator
MARIKALISRKIKVSNPKIVDIKTNLLINIEEHLVYLDSKKIELPRKEFEILNLLYSNPKKIFTRIEITNLVWGNDSEDKDHNIDVFISKIRKELGGEVIKTIKGVGYTLTAA